LEKINVIKFFQGSGAESHECCFFFRLASFGKSFLFFAEILELFLRK